jgi:hypothetical protein
MTGTQTNINEAQQITPVNGDYFAVTNPWGASGLSFAESVGMSALQPDLTVDFRLVWDYPAASGEVLSYPTLIYGVGRAWNNKGSTNAKMAATAKMPAQIGKIQSFTSKVDSISIPAWGGSGHLSYDGWFTNNFTLTGNPGAGASLHSEFMVPIYADPNIGYGVPDWPPEAAAGRKPPMGGRNPYIYVERVTIQGKEYDSYRAAPMSQYWSNNWQFLVMVPVVYPESGPHVVDWRAMFDYWIGKGWADNNLYCLGLELGVEAVASSSPAKGDMTLRGFRVDTVVVP